MQSTSTETVQQLTDETFDTEITGPGPALVDFGATWCSLCRAIAPAVERLATEEAGRLRVYTVDVDASPGIANRYGVAGLPTLILFKDGEPAERLVGYRTKAQLAAALAPHLASGEALAPGAPGAPGAAS
jgi:thioredoxin